MVASTANEGCAGGTHNEIDCSRAPLLVPLLVPKRRGGDDIRVDIPPLQPTLLLQSSGRNVSASWFMAPISIFRRTVDRKEEASLSTPTPAGVRRRLHMRFMRRIDWVSLRKACKEWLKNPMNIALLLWSVCVACFLTLLFLLYTELVDGALPATASRDRWIEICNQVLNALFTLVTLYVHPKLFHHLVLLCRWRSDDIVELRKVYCKNGAYRPREWAHMTVVMLLVHIACFAQYVFCGLYWGYSSRERPEFAADFFAALGILASVLAGVYTVYSPLGREYDSGDASEGESQGQVTTPRKQSQVGLQRVAVSKPEWIGGLFDLGDDVPVALLSFCCTCCVLGWNMGRLGFGNTYVHIATFVLLFIAPYWVFSISALHIQNDLIRYALRTTGLVLSLLCLLYGGFWRIQIRRRFGLPASTSCCGNGSMMDYVQWMFCWGCSLAQEVRTGNFYDVEDDSLYRKHGDGGGDYGDGGSVSSCDGGRESPAVEKSSQLLGVDAGSLSRTGGDDDTMVPPAPALMQVEDKDCDDNRDDRLNSAEGEKFCVTF